MNEVIIHKGRVNSITINLGYDASADTFTSQIRSQPTVDATLIEDFVVDDTDAADGTLVLTLDDTSRSIDVVKGYMDLKRVTGGAAVPLFDSPIEVAFRGTVTS